MKRMMLVVSGVVMVGCQAASPDDTTSGTSAIVGDGLRSPESVMDDLMEYQPFIGTMKMPDGRTVDVKLSFARRAEPEASGTTTMHVCEGQDVDSCGDGDGAIPLRFTLDRSTTRLFYVLNLRSTRDETARRTHSLDYQDHVGDATFGGYVPTVKLDTGEFSVLVPRRFAR